MTMVAGIIIVKGQIKADPKHIEAAREFIARLRGVADDAERSAIGQLPYKARLLLQNARAARRDADRIEKTI